MHNYPKEIHHCVLSARCDDRTEDVRRERSYPEFLNREGTVKRPSLTHFATHFDLVRFRILDISWYRLEYQFSFGSGMIGKAGLSPIYNDYSNVSLGKKRKKINKHFDNLHVCISNFSRGKLLDTRVIQNFFHGNECQNDNHCDTLVIQL